VTDDLLTDDLLTDDLLTDGLLSAHPFFVRGGYDDGDEDASIVNPFFGLSSPDIAWRVTPFLGFLLLTLPGLPR